MQGAIILEAMRPRQWYKNGLLLAGLLFSGSFLDPAKVLPAILALLFFCLLSGGVYLFNDAWDAPADASHPTKKHRPVASGRIKPRLAVKLSLFFALAAILGCLLVEPLLALVALAYAALGLGYTAWFRDIYILDAIMLSLGYVGRAVAGCLAAGVWISPALILCTFLVAMYLTYAKRHSDLGRPDWMRPSMKQYDEQSLRGYMLVTMSMAIMAYAMYAYFEGPMMVTIPFAIYGLFRHYSNVCRTGMGDFESIFRDRAMVLNLALWLGLIICIVLLK